MLSRRSPPLQMGSSLCPLQPMGAQSSILYDAIALPAAQSGGGAEAITRCYQTSKRAQPALLSMPQRSWSTRLPLTLDPPHMKSTWSQRRSATADAAPNSAVLLSPIWSHVGADGPALRTHHPWPKDGRRPLIGVDEVIGGSRPPATARRWRACCRGSAGRQLGIVACPCRENTASAGRSESCGDREAGPGRRDPMLKNPPWRRSGSPGFFGDFRRKRVPAIRPKSADKLRSPTRA
jgi:hypothetical protein